MPLLLKFIFTHRGLIDKVFREIKLITATLRASRKTHAPELKMITRNNEMVNPILITFHMEVPLLTAWNDFSTIKKNLILLNIYTNARNRYVSDLEKHLFLD